MQFPVSTYATYKRGITRLTRRIALWRSNCTYSGNNFYWNSWQPHDLDEVNPWSADGGHRTVAGCASLPPKHQENLCTIFDQYPEWYDAAKESQDRWGTPPHILMAFVKQESSFRHDATPLWDWFLFIPLGRQSSAEGYAQAKDETWEEL
ncbi:MAG: hypothetical protein ABIU05_24365 [Nitrospirales bacterium]